MIIKDADDKQQDINALNELLLHPAANSVIKGRIEQEIRNIQAGIRGEDQSAYELKVAYGNNPNWMVLHDLRIEHDGVAAQIDHLLINRFLDIWVLESKHFSEGIAINDHGEFTAFWKGKPYGVPSPIEQNSRHITILNRVLESGKVSLPSRLGLAMKPALKSFVLVSKSARIIRPKVAIAGLDTIYKADMLSQALDKDLKAASVFAIAKVISADTLETLARDIANLHKPIRFNLAAKFGLPPLATQKAVPPESSRFSFTAAEPIQKPAPSEAVAPTIQPTTPQAPACHSCNAALSPAVANFCLINKARFNGNLYCFACQKQVRSKV